MAFCEATLSSLFGNSGSCVEMRDQLASHCFKKSEIQKMAEEYKEKILLRSEVNTVSLFFFFVLPVLSCPGLTSLRTATKLEDPAPRAFGEARQAVEQEPVRRDRRRNERGAAECETGHSSFRSSKNERRRQLRRRCQLTRARCLKLEKYVERIQRRGYRSILVIFKAGFARRFRAEMRRLAEEIQDVELFVIDSV